MVDPIKKLGYPGSSPDPVPCCKGVKESLCQYVCPHCRPDGQVTVTHAGTLELILDVTSQPIQRDPEEVFHEVAGKLQPLV